MITKEAIEAACAALNKRDRGNAISIPDVVAMLTAAFAAMPSTDLQAENERPRAALERSLLIECYRSGQISEAAWQEHLEADPELRAMVDRPVDGVIAHAASITKLSEARIAELEADHLEERLAMSGRIQFLEDAFAVPHLEQRIAELEKRLADAERVIEPFARLGTMSTHSINEDGTASFSFFRTADMNAFTDARRAARAYMEGK